MSKLTSFYLIFSSPGKTPGATLKKALLIFGIILMLFSSCKVVLISGYDPLLDETSVKLKRDFNLFWLRFDRSIRDNDPKNQNYQNFLADYDQLDVDLLILDGRADMLPAKSQQVKTQVQDLRKLFSSFKSVHQKGVKDIAPNDLLADDKHDYKNGINSALNAIMVLQQELKSAEK